MSYAPVREKHEYDVEKGEERKRALIKFNLHDIILCEPQLKAL